MNKKIFFTLAVLVFLVLGTFITIKFAKGYRFNLREKKIVDSGLLVVNSQPTGASVYINDKLSTATNDTLNLPPGEYKVKIIKDGFTSWEKILQLKKELVTQANARLLPSVTDLKALTINGATNITPSPDGEKLAYVVASASASPKNGLWLLELTSKPLSYYREPRQIAKNTSSFNLSQAKLVWSPNSKQVLAWNTKDSYLLDIDKLNELISQVDVTARLPLILNEWQKELNLQRKEQMSKLPKKMADYIDKSSKNVYFSPDAEKVMYTATASATIEEGLIPPLPASSTQKQARQLEPNKIYIYDLKEDKNFYITDVQKDEKEEKITKLEKQLNQIKNQYSAMQAQAVQWFPTSNHLILIENDKIIILEYDGTNKATVYAGLFEKTFTYPSPDGSKLLILTSLNPDTSLPVNLYAIDLK